MTTQTTPPSELEAAYQNAILAGTSPSTRRGYARDVRYFWCWAHLALNLKEHYPVLVETLLRFILTHAGDMDPQMLDELHKNRVRTKRGPLRVRTIRRYLASLSVAHQERGYESPTFNAQIRLILRRLQRAQATLPSNRKDAITADILRRMVDSCDDSLHGLRDEAILMVGFASGGRRRSELVNLKVSDLKKVDGGYIIQIRKSKTDQAGKGHEVPLLGEAAQTLTKWLVRSGIRNGNLFRGILPNGTLNDGVSPRTINRIIKMRAKQAGMDEKRYGAHSLRSGFITESARKGAAIGDSMALSGHRDSRVAQGYYRNGVLMSNPTAHLLD